MVLITDINEKTAWNLVPDKISIYLSLLLHCNYLSLLGAIEGLGTKRIFGIYLGINQNLSKLSKPLSLNLSAIDIPIKGNV